MRDGSSAMVSLPTPRSPALPRSGRVRCGWRCVGGRLARRPRNPHTRRRACGRARHSCVGASMCATRPINKLSPGDLNQRSFPGPSSHSVAPCSWFSSNSFKRANIYQGTRCGHARSGRAGSKTSFGAVLKGVLATKRVSVQRLHSKRRPLLGVQPNSVVKTTELTARHGSVWL